MYLALKGKSICLVFGKFMENLRENVKEDVMEKKKDLKPKNYFLYHFKLV